MDFGTAKTSRTGGNDDHIRASGKEMARKGLQTEACGYCDLLGIEGEKRPSLVIITDQRSEGEQTAIEY
jgi:hypothetical protein